MRHALRRFTACLVLTALLASVPASVAAQDPGAPVASDQALLPVDQFYDLPAEIAAAPGALLRSEPLTDRVLPAESRAWRIQYVTTMRDGSPAAAVATVLAPANPPETPLPVIAWAHGTVGLMQRCLPSLTTIPFLAIPAVQQAVDEQWVVVAPDYQVDAHGIHPFLIGEGEARSTLDAIRAAHAMPELNLAPETVIWGHSQGGHAALWATTIAPTYAPDLTVAGTVAIAPAADLLTLLQMHGGDATASLIGAFLANDYSTFSPDVVYDDAVRDTAREIGRDLASRCLLDPQDAPVMASLIGDLGGESLLATPTSAALAAKLAANTPLGPFPAPVVIAQGLTDDVVLPAATDAYVADRCAEGIPIEHWRIPDQGHRSIVAPGSPLEAPLIAWTQHRFAGETPATTCTEGTIGG